MPLKQLAKEANRALNMTARTVKGRAILMFAFFTLFSSGAWLGAAGLPLIALSCWILWVVTGAGHGHRHLKHYDQVIAIFKPKTRDNLKPFSRQFIGRVGVFQASYIIDDGDYKGQWAMEFPQEWRNSLPQNISFDDCFFWCPIEDLEILKRVET